MLKSGKSRLEHFPARQDQLNEACVVVIVVVVVIVPTVVVVVVVVHKILLFKKMS